MSDTFAPEVKNGRYQKRSMIRLERDKNALFSQDDEYKNFLRKSVNRFRKSSNSRIESCNIKVPAIIKNCEIISEKHRRIQNQILRKTMQIEEIAQRRLSQNKNKQKIEKPRL